MKLRKIVALFLAILSLFASIAISSQAAETDVSTVSPRSITIASCVFRDFYSNSSSSTITLSQGCNFVSFKVNCESGSDEMIAVITDLSNEGAYNTVLPFDADGSTTTFETYFGMGSYEITLYGANKKHTLGLVAFST